MRSAMNQPGRAMLLLLASAAWAAASMTSMPLPGAVNYVEGQVALDGQNLSAASIGSALLETNHVLSTGQGRAELLLTPGVFLRMGDNSEVRMVSPDLAATQVELLRGSAMLEVTELFKENNLSVWMGGVPARIDKMGLYEFNLGEAAVRVLDGEVTVSEGDLHVNLKKRHAVRLAAGQPFKAQSFNKGAVGNDPLYVWSKLRSEYEAQANIETAQTFVVNGGLGWYGLGWYWDPWCSFYAFLPGDGILYSPFGWGFYPPGLVWRAPHRIYNHGPLVGSQRANSTAGASARAAHAASGFRAGGGGGGGFHGGGGGGGGSHGGGGGHR